jgi:hypothetical protein
VNRSRFFTEKFAHHDLDERSLKRLVDSRCADCGHPWQMHFDQEHAASRPCQSSMNGRPNCNCMAYAPPDLELTAALALLDNPLIVVAKKAQGLMPTVEDEDEDEPLHMQIPVGVRSEELAAQSVRPAPPTTAHRSADADADADAQAESEAPSTRRPIDP